MQHILLLIKDFKRVILSLFLIIVFSYNALGQSAPQVNINVNILPPYSPYYSDYSGANAGKVLLIVRNLTSSQKRIKLTGELKGNNGIRISTKSTYIPLQPIILQPNETKQLNGAALRDVFDLNSLNVYGIDKVKLVQTSRLPEGDYTFCLQAVDMDNNQVITNTAPQGCTNVTIAYPEAPILVSPANNNSVFSRKPQSVIFNWINPGFAPMGTQYVLQVAEMPLISTDPNQVLNSVSFPLVNKTLNGFSYVLSPSDPPLIVGKRYAWRVKAIDPSGRIVFKNGGVSGANVFTYENPVQLTSGPTLISPEQNANITAIDKGTQFNWTAVGNASFKGGYVLQVVEMPNSGGNAAQLFSANKFVINQSVNDLSYVLPSTSPLLIPGKRYAWRVTTADIIFNSKSNIGGQSSINIFTYNPIINAEPPILVNPIANAKITISSPQNVYFKWKNKNRVITNSIKYNFQIVELATPTSDPTQALSTGMYFLSKNVSQDSIILTNSDPLLKAGKKYAWRVRAYDETGKTKFKNNGFSEASVFEYNNLGEGEVLPLAPLITSPKLDEIIAQLNDFSQPKINIAWNGSNTPNAVTYEIKIIKVMPGFDAATALDNNVQVLLSYAYGQVPNVFTLEPPKANENLIFAKNHGRITLEEDATYAIQVIATGKTPDGKLIRFENFGKSNIVQFKYKGAPKPVPTEAPTPITSTIAGKFFYRFKENYEQPTHGLLGFPEVKVVQQFAGGNDKTLKDVNVTDNTKFPAYFENNTFPIGSSIHPLKNVRLTFKYVVLKSKNKNPKNIKELVPHLGNSTDMYALTLDGEKISGKNKIGTLNLNEDGSFSYTFVNNRKIGYLGTEKEFSYFRVIKIFVGNDITSAEEESDDRYFTSPDLYVAPQLGKVVTLPDEIVFVKSYNYDVKVVSDKTGKQAVTAGNVLANYPVQMLDNHKSMSFSGPLENQGDVVFTDTSDPEDNKLSMPWEANAENYVNQAIRAKDKKYNNVDLPLVDIVNTDGNGIAHFKNLLNVHTHMPQVAVNPFEGNYTYEPQSGEVIKRGSGGGGNFNSDFIPETIVAKQPIVVRPNLPEIYLRAMSLQNGLTQAVPFAKVHIVTYTKNAKSEPNILIGDEYFNTDANGYLQLKNLQADLLRTITIIKQGFNDKVVTKGIYQDILRGQRYPESVEQIMEGAGSVVGRVVNEKGEPVMANVKIGNGPYVKTTTYGYFQIENTQSNYQLVTIAPTVDNYFGETLYPNIKPNDYTLITNDLGKTNGTIVLKEKLHRLVFKIVNADDGKGVSAYVGIGNNTLEYNSTDPYTGMTKEFGIASPGTEFKVRVVANGFVTYEDYVSSPKPTKEATTITITLKKAQVISGIVRDKTTGKPIAGARVYTVSGTNDDGEVQNSTLTGSDGKYTLFGSVNPKVWVSYFQMYADVPIKIYAVRSGTPGYVRSEAEVSPANPVANFSLEPTRLGIPAEIWGLPIEISSSESVDYKTTIISGAFIKLPSNNGFKTELKDVKLPFTKLTVLTTGKGYDPIVTAIDLEVTSLKVMAYEKYACELIGSDKENVYNKLSIKKTDGYGSLAGYLSSELSNFNFSYKYTGKFLIGSSYYVLGSGTVNVPTKVFSSAPNYITNSSYKLQALYGKSDFSIHNFNAKLSSGSTVSADGYSMNAEVSLNVPLLGATVLPAGSFKVTQNNIEWKQYTGNISLPLEGWKITGTGLMYDINQGGFKVLDGTLVTDLPQVILKDLMIMPTSVDLGITKLTGKENLSLANVAPLKLAVDAKMTLNYDPAAPFDQKPHYRLNLTSSSKTVAYVNDLPGIGSSQINIRMLSTYSDGKHKSIIVDATKINYYNVLWQDVTGIEVANDFFTLTGNTNLEIPGAPGNVTGRFKYMKNPSSQFADKNGNVLMIEKLQTDVEMEGKVRFEGTSFQISDNNLSVDGNVLIYKNGPQDAIKGIKGKITKTIGTIKMEFLPKQQIAMGTKSIAIVSGGNEVSNNKWSLVKFVGQPIGFGNNGKNLFAKDKDLLDFVVNGALETNKNGKQIQLDEIRTPFGNLAVTFDFDKGSFGGTLELTDPSGTGIPIGPVTVHTGTMDLLIDRNGFIVVVAVTNASVSALPSCLAGGFKTGIALGYYGSPIPSYLTKKLLGVTLVNQLPSDLNNGLKGFYVNVMKSLDKNSLPQLPGPPLNDIPFLGKFLPVFDFSAGVDIYVLVDFDKSFSTSIGGMAFAYASCLYDLEVCTIGLSGRGDGFFDLHYNDKQLTGTLSFGISASLSYCVGPPLTLSPKLVLQKDASGFSFKPSL